MPVILALAIALTAAVLSTRMTLSVQFLLDHLEQKVAMDDSTWEAHQQFDKVLEVLSRSNSRNDVVEVKKQGWQIEGSGTFFNPLLWLSWGEEHRERFAKGLKSHPSGGLWLERLESLKNCFPETQAERVKLFDDCAVDSLPEGMALFPENTPLDLNEAPLYLIQMMLPEISAGLWTTFQSQKERAPFISMADFNERLPEIATISPLPESLDIKSRYLWLKWKRPDGQSFIWLLDKQATGAAKILFVRKG